jgi:hypothetical protein
MARLNIDDQSRPRHLQQKQVGSHMPIPSHFFGITAKQLLVLVTVGCVAAYLFNTHDESLPENLALETFIRDQEQVGEQVGAVLGIALVRQIQAYPANGAPGYKRSTYTVEGERGRLMVTLKQVEGEAGAEVTEIRRP